MINVNINPFIEFHWGYHKELIENPPEDVKYHLAEIDARIPVEALIKYCNDIKNFIFFYDNKVLRRPNEYYYIPYFYNTKDLIHSINRPIINNCPYVVDIDPFVYLWVFNYQEIVLMKNIEILWIPEKLNKNQETRLSIMSKYLKSKNCKKILPWSYQCLNNQIRRYVKDEAILSKTEVLYPAVKNINFEKKENDIVTLFFCSGTGNMFLKGGDYVLKLYDILSKKYDIKLNFIARGVDEKIKKKLTNDKNINFVDTTKKLLEKEEIKKYYINSDIFVLPTRIESFGMMFLEAMNFKLPIIAPYGPLVPTTNEIINNNKSGFLIDYKITKKSRPIEAKLDFEDMVKKCEMLINSDSLRRKMGLEGKKEIEEGKFNIEKRNKRLRKIYEEALA